MRNALLLSLLIAGSVSLIAQTQNPKPSTPPAAPAPAQPAPAAQPPAKGTTGQPATAAPAPAKGTTTPPAARATTGSRGTTAAASTSARGGIALTVTDMRGMTLPGVAVDVTGVTARQGQTDAAGQVNFPSLPVGTYRLRFTGEAVTAFEKEITLTSGRPTTLDIALAPAPAPREIIKEIAPAAPPPSLPAPPAVGPAGEPQLLSLYDMAERELKSKQPRRELLVSCSGNLRSTIVFLNTPPEQPQRLYDGAEVSYYVLGGEATFHVGGKDSVLNAGGYVCRSSRRTFRHHTAWQQGTLVAVDAEWLTM